jgi:opacity protein-like surface antigen
MYDLAAYYWLTPQLALAIEGFTVNNAIETSASNGGHIDVNVKHAEFATRYYGDLHALLSRVHPGFIRPFGTIGAGLYSMTQTSFTAGVAYGADTHLGMSLGAGLAFEIAPKLLSLELLGRWNSVTFNDTHREYFWASNGVPDLTGELVSWNANIHVAL